MRKVSVFARFPSIGIALLAGALATTTAPPDASAQGKAPAAAAKKPDKKTRDAARKAYGQAEKDYEAGNYDKAYEGFEKANELIPAPQAQYWMAMSLLKQDKKEEAAAAFQKLLDDPNVSKLGDEKLAEAKAELSKLKAKDQGELNLTTTPAGATVTIDGEPQTGETPMIVKLPPGAHKVTISSPGYESKDLDVEIVAGKTVDQNVELALSESPAEPIAGPPPEPVEPAPGPPPATEPRSKVPAYVTLGIAGASAAVGTFFGIRALSAKSDFDDDPTTDKADDVERNALIADMAFGVAITLGVTGVVLLTSSDSEPAAEAKTRPQKPRLNFAPYVSKQGGGAAARLTF